MTTTANTVTFNLQYASEENSDFEWSGWIVNSEDYPYFTPVSAEDKDRLPVVICHDAFEHQADVGDTPLTNELCALGATLSTRDVSAHQFDLRHDLMSLLEYLDYELQEDCDLDAYLPVPPTPEENCCVDEHVIQICLGLDADLDCGFPEIDDIDDEDYFDQDTIISRFVGWLLWGFEKAEERHGESYNAFDLMVAGIEPVMQQLNALVDEHGLYATYQPVSWNVTFSFDEWEAIKIEADSFTTEAIEEDLAYEEQYQYEDE